MSSDTSESEQSCIGQCLICGAYGKNMIFAVIVKTLDQDMMELVAKKMKTIWFGYINAEESEQKIFHKDKLKFS